MAALHFGPPAIGFSVDKPKNTLSTGARNGIPGYTLSTFVGAALTYLGAAVYDSGNPQNLSVRTK